MGDVVLKDEGGVSYSYENIKTQGWLDGHTSGLEAAAVWIRAKATALFEAGKYDEARQLREMAVKMVGELRPQMERASREYEKECPDVIEVQGPIAPRRKAR